jgi:hypothetical protein
MRDTEEQDTGRDDGRDQADPPRQREEPRRHCARDDDDDPYGAVRSAGPFADSVLVDEPPRMPFLGSHVKPKSTRCLQQRLHGDPSFRVTFPNTRPCDEGFLTPRVWAAYVQGDGLAIRPVPRSKRRSRAGPHGRDRSERTWNPATRIPLGNGRTLRVIQVRPGRESNGDLDLVVVVGR